VSGDAPLAGALAVAGGRIAVDPDWATLLHGDGLAASRAFDARVRRDPADLWALRGLGLSFAEREIEVRAVGILAGVAAREPEHAETWYWIGQLAPRDTHAALAHDAFVRATELRPDEPDYWAARAGREEATQALASLEQATLLDPDHPEAWRIAAGTYRRMGRHQAAANAMRRVTARLRSPDTLRALATALRDGGEREEARRAEHDATAIAIDPAYRSIGPGAPPREGFGLVAKLLLGRGLLEEARAAYAAGGEAPGLQHGFWWGMAAELAGEGRTADALGVLDRLGADLGGDPVASTRLWRDRAVLLGRLGREPESELAWEMAAMHRDFDRWDHSGPDALVRPPGGGTIIAWVTIDARVGDPWTDRVRPFGAPPGE
jgi:tetratricopeptide (TPR) repeat protein